MTFLPRPPFPARLALALSLVSTLLVASIAPASAQSATAVNSASLATVGGRLAYIDATGGLLVLDSATGTTQTLVSGSPGRVLHTPRWSPDGARIAFFAHPATTNAPRQDDVYVVELAGGPARRVSHHAAPMTTLAWYPDSQAVAFGIGDEAPYSAGRATIDGVQEVALFGTPLDDMGPRGATPSPDGQYVATTRMSFDAEGVPRLSVYVSAADGSDDRLLAEFNLPFASPISWRPDSSAVVFSAGTDVMEVPVDGSMPQRAFSIIGGVVGTPIWSADSASIAFYYNGGEVLGDYGPVMQWRMGIRRGQDRQFLYYPDVDTSGRLIWVNGTQGILFTTAGPDGTRVLRLFLYEARQTSTLATFDSPFADVYDWHA